MHGTIFAELQKFVDSTQPAGTWDVLKQEAGLADRSWDVLSSYPDEEVLALVTAASEATGAPPADLIEAFGEFIAQDLLKMYWGMIEDDWRTLDVIERTEETIHKLVRLDHPEAAPPRLSVERTSADEVVLTYDSARQLCRLAIGIARGLANHFDEVIVVEEAACQLHGDRACILHFRRTSG